MKNKYSDLVDALKDMGGIEALVSSGSFRLGGCGTKLAKLTERLSVLKASIEDSDDIIKKDLIELVGCAEKGAMLGLRIVEKGSATAEGYTYALYRWDIYRLRTLARKRRAMIEKVNDKLHFYTDQLIVDNLGREDAMLISLLMAMTVIDTVVHKNEEKIIRRRYKKITMMDPDEEVLASCLEQADSATDTVIEQLRAASKDIHPDIKKLMFLSAIEVAISDSHLHEVEVDLLLRVKDALNLDGDGFDSLKTADDVVRLVGRSRRLKKTARSEIQSLAQYSAAAH